MPNLMTYPGAPIGNIYNVARTATSLEFVFPKSEILQAVQINLAEFYTFAKTFEWCDNYIEGYTTIDYATPATTGNGATTYLLTDPTRRDTST